MSTWTRLGIGLLAFGLGLGCALRQGDLDEPELIPICVPAPAHGYWAEGEGTFIYTRDGGTPGACTCMTWEEAWDEVGFDELFERALESCNEAAEPYDFAWDECETNLAEGKWIANDGLGEDGAFNVENLSCDEPLPAACAVSEGHPSPVSLLVLVALLGLRRRPGAHPHTFGHR